MNLTVVAHQLRSAENLGAIARLMANFGFTRLILSEPVTHDFRGAETLAVGAEPVDYSGKVKCCGFPVILEKEDIALAMNGANLKEAKDAGADVMVTPCPLCHMSLDIYQERAGQKVNAKLDLPVLHFPQMIGLAMGVPAKDLGVQRHLVPVDSIVEAVEARKAKQ